MDSRPILNKEGKLGIFIDSISFNQLLDDNNEKAKLILKYYSSDFFEFIRSPSITTHEELNNVIAYEKVVENGQIKNLKIIRDTTDSSIYFEYKMGNIESIAKQLYEKPIVNGNEKENILLAFIQAVFNSYDNKNILITEDQILLKNRLWFESHFPGRPLNIVSLEEALELMSLFLKFRKQYLVESRSRTNKWLWYWHLFRKKLPNYNVDDPILAALADRFVYALMAVDEIGMQYYSGVNNDTMADTIYHFNYLITLISGIFDSLAIKTKNQYNLTFNGDNIPSRISIDNNAGQALLGALRAQNQPLRDHITDNVHFISLINNLRQVVVHKDMYQKSSFEYRDESERWQANFIKVPEGDIEPIRHLNDAERPYDPITEWGIYRLAGEHFIEPYNFSKIAMKKLIEFVNRYLELLGYNDFFQSLRDRNPADDFLVRSGKFEKNALSIFL